MSNMETLKVIENGLVSIYEDKETRRVINARELHEFLESGTRFNDWISRRIEQYGFIEGEDFYSILSKTSEGGRPTTEYYIVIDMGKELAMVENNEKGRQVRKYFIECEKRAKSLNNPASARETEKLDIQRKRLEIMEKNARSKQANILKALGNEFKDVLSGDSLRSIASHVALLTTGELLIPLPEVEKTYSATEVGKRRDISSNMVGKIANKFNLKTPEYGIFVLDKAVGHSKQVSNFRYNEKGANKVIELWDSGSYYESEPIAENVEILQTTDNAVDC
jgi:phage anti-repressor protein